jgi:hypothetical protein
VGVEKVRHQKRPLGCEYARPEFFFSQFV